MKPSQSIPAGPSPSLASRLASHLAGERRPVGSANRSAAAAHFGVSRTSIQYSLRKIATRQAAVERSLVQALRVAGLGLALAVEWEHPGEFRVVVRDLPDGPAFVRTFELLADPEAGPALEAAVAYAVGQLAMRLDDAPPSSRAAGWSWMPCGPPPTGATAPSRRRPKKKGASR